ncbi:MAG: hypothetical protein JWM60_862 [Solirubrobacterales bacterium]|nr:hypothetical protein [Solirubrobacterales bacterium]
MLTEPEIAILQAVDRLTPDGYGETDGEAIEDQLHRAGVGVPPGIQFARTVGKLREESFLKAYVTGGGRPVQVELTGLGRQAAREAGGFERSYSAARQLLASDGFAAAFPRAFGPWADAERLLWGDNVDAQLSTVGHKIREAAQAFATAAIERYDADDPPSDVKLVKKRLGAVIAHNRQFLSPKKRKVLEDLGDLWESTVDLIERQEHSAQKEGEPVTFEDGRRIVMLTMFLMIEFVTILDDTDDPPPATLEPG